MTEQESATETTYEEIAAKALSILQPGVVFRMFSKPRPNSRVCHVRAIVDGEWIVYRVWLPGKGWRYTIEHALSLGFLIENQIITVLRKEKI